MAAYVEMLRPYAQQGKIDNPALKDYGKRRIVFKGATIARFALCFNQGNRD